MPSFIDIAGHKYGRLLVVQQSNVKNSIKLKWECLCDCGNTVFVTSNDLRTQKTLSCGCYKSEKTRAAKTKHGYRHKKTYTVWSNMIARCTKNNPNYSNRGIKVCDEWLVFENFLKDMGECPDGLSIDRIDVNGNYELSNCRWATRKEQAQNTRRSVLSEADVSVIKTILNRKSFLNDKQIAKQFDVDKHVINSIKLGKTWRNVSPLPV